MAVVPVFTGSPRKPPLYVRLENVTICLFMMGTCVEGHNR